MFGGQGMVMVVPTGEIKFSLYKGRSAVRRGEFSGEVPLWFYEKLEDLKKTTKMFTFK